MGWEAIEGRLGQQHGVISRRQALDLGLRPHDLARLVRNRVWARILPGVYVDHTGPASWLQRAWAGVLHCSPAALGGWSALRAYADARRQRGPLGPAGALERIDLVVPLANKRAPIDGYRVLRSVRFEQDVAATAWPPRVRVTEATLDVASAAATDHAAVAILADVCQARWTTPARLLAALDGRARIRRRGWLASVLTDVDQGTCSVLEHAYLTRVERPHRLPTGRRQVQDATYRVFRDVVYEDQSVIVELDGRLFHGTSGQRERDLERDLDARLDGRVTIRLGWRQCTERACYTAGKLAQILYDAGWRGGARPCGPGCPV
ncbi:type IV toxin-antitoxin system AbiEi family antitoxin domain-containing protein [Propionibacteriaceae bacterium Y2011]